MIPQCTGFAHKPWQTAPLLGPKTLFPSFWFPLKIHKASAPLGSLSWDLEWIAPLLHAKPLSLPLTSPSIRQLPPAVTKLFGGRWPFQPLRSWQYMCMNHTEQKHRQNSQWMENGEVRRYMSGALFPLRLSVQSHDKIFFSIGKCTPREV